MRTGLLASCLFAVSLLDAQVSPYTEVPVSPPDSTGAYRLLIGGHFHGASSNRSGFPAATLLANLDTINAIDANVLLSTGDLFLIPDRDSARYARSLFSELKVALFNAPGNHDLEGKAYHRGAEMPVSISMGPDRILLVDTERNNSDIRGDQLEALEELATAAEGGGLRRVFIVSHRPIWSEEEPRYGDLFKNNTRSTSGCNYSKEVLPVLRRIAAHAEVFWISGSMAGRAPASIFFQPHEKNITYIQSAIRDELRDALLIADVDTEGVTWSTLSLTGLPMEPVEKYDADWWKAKQGEVPPFRWKLLPYLVKKNLSYPSFWYGFVIALCPLLLVGLVRRWGKR
ncbi:MAG: hypothetical protein R2818_09505 [Flavobacteriales bacterium]